MLSRPEILSRVGFPTQLKASSFIAVPIRPPVPSCTDPSDSLIRQKRIVFYNVENLFYPSDDSLKNDDDFTPSGLFHWTYRRYFYKLNRIAQVIISMSEQGKPVLIGFCEIENRRVLEDLISKTLLRSFGYRIIHQESPDLRGIDVALLYDPKVFIPEKYASIRIFNENQELLLTRNILSVTGQLYGKYRCHLFVNHWPSRRGGQIASEPRRMLVASHLKQEVDRIFTEESNPNIIIMGDFNDEPVDKSLQTVLKASEYQNGEDGAGQLFNLMYDHYRLGHGSHYRKNNFIESSVIDQFIVSEAIIKGHNGMKLADIRGEIYRKPFLINEKNGMPLRSYQGLKYLGGISDHLPVILDVIFDDVDE
jgi:hypothetical protein